MIFKEEMFKFSENDNIQSWEKVIFYIYQPERVAKELSQNVGFGYKITAVWNNENVAIAISSATDPEHDPEHAEIFWAIRELIGFEPTGKGGCFFQVKENRILISGRSGSLKASLRDEKMNDLAKTLIQRWIDVGCPDNDEGR